METLIVNICVCVVRGGPVKGAIAKPVDLKINEYQK